MSATVAPILAPIPSRDEVLSALTLNAPPPPPHTFEIALVMGGTVSAGAYTAGAADFLIEALDCFQAEKNRSKAAYHDVVLKAVSGTSGGGVVAAILARALAYQFPSQYLGAPAAAGDTGNPLYDTWVNRLDLMPMLATNDIAEGSVPSLLNANVIDQTAAAIESYVGAAPAARTWLGAPLTVFMTHTNLSGVPIEIDFGGGQFQRFIEHADYVRFAVSYPGQLPYTDAKPYEFTLTFPAVKPAPQDNSWPVLGQFACASSAFPVGFPTRLLDRPVAHYHYRVISLAPNPQTADDFWVLQADWTAMLNTNNSPTIGNLRYSAVDGGVTDNEPIEMARTALCGLLGRNPRDPAEANRAVWLIDPFAGEADMAPFSVTGMPDGGTSSLNASLQQGRYSTADLVLAIDPDIYSRYMLCAHNNGQSGGKVLATAGLSAFLGFACEDFRRYDYYLGRKNCQDFLLNIFRQTKANPVFSAWTAPQIAAFVDASGDLPIIPLFGAAAELENLLPWPAGKLTPAIFKGGIDARLQAILDAAVPDTFWARVGAALGGCFAATPAADIVIGKLNDALTEWNLNAPGRP